LPLRNRIGGATTYHIHLRLLSLSRLRPTMYRLESDSDLSFFTYLFVEHPFLAVLYVRTKNFICVIIACFKNLFEKTNDNDSCFEALIYNNFYCDWYKKRQLQFEWKHYMVHFSNTNKRFVNIEEFKGKKCLFHVTIECSRHPVFTVSHLRITRRRQGSLYELTLRTRL